jgi:hypothetical protein
MERRINKTIETHQGEFKEKIKTTILNNLTALKSVHPNIDSFDEYFMNILQFIYDYENLELSEQDFVKRKRVKNKIPIIDQCIAKRANGEQCSRRKKDGSTFCGTHIKGTPHGIVDNSDTINALNHNDTNKKVEVWLEDIGGIMFYIDNVGNIYDYNEVNSNKVNPKIINKYKKEFIDGVETYSIIDSN